MKKIIALILIVVMLTTIVYSKEIEGITAKSYILVNGENGDVLIEKNADEQLPPASITKIMTMLLLMEAVDNGTVSLDDVVTISDTAAIHEGSHVFLEVGEQITVSDLLKAVAVASGNDASIAVAELLSGTQMEFVKVMNNKASELGMKNTHFVNCNGLDAEGHVSTARDIAIMTYELLKHKKILEYTTIWMDTLRNGTFDLANTNKLIRFYEGANGMKTGSTSKAGYCLSATALRNDVQLIAVVLGSNTTKERFSDATTLLNYGFNNYKKSHQSTKGDIIDEVIVENGVKEKISAVVENDCDILIKNSEINDIKSEIILNKTLKAPITKGQIIGEMKYKAGEREVGRVNLISDCDIAEISISYLLKRFLSLYIFAK